MTALIIMQLATIAILLTALYLWQRNRFIVDMERIAHMIAAHLLADYTDDVHLLDEYGTKGYARHKYMQMVTEWGLPSAAVDHVADSVYTAVRLAQGKTDKPQPVAAGGNVFYE